MNTVDVTFESALALSEPDADGACHATIGAEWSQGRAAYGVLAEKVVNPVGYGVSHSSSIYLIDGEGRLRALMPFGRPADDFVHDVRVLLAK